MMDNKQFSILAGVIIGKGSNRDQASLFFFFACSRGSGKTCPDIV